MILSGTDAIDFAERTSKLLNKYSDPIEGPRHGVTVDEARDIAREDRSLVWIKIPDPADIIACTPCVGPEDSPH